MLNNENRGRHWLTITVAEGGYIIEDGDARPVVLPAAPGGRAKVRRLVREWAEAITSPLGDAPAGPASAGNGEG